MAPQRHTPAAYAKSNGIELCYDTFGDPGETDPLIPLACGIDTAKSVPGSTLVTVKGMGHALSIPFWPQIIEAIAAHAV